MVIIKSDVVVVGAGPAGSTTARIIAEKGYDVVLIEKDEYPGKNNVCAGGTHKSVITNLELKSDVIEKEFSSDKHHFSWGSNILNVDTVTVSRKVFDKYLADEAVENGTKLVTNTTINKVSVGDDGVNLSSKETTIDSKLVVFADGPNTLAYKKFGIGFKPDSDKTMIGLSCEVEWKNNPFDQLEYYYGPDISPWGYGWIFPGQNKLNVGVVCLYSKIQSNIIEQLDYLFHDHPLTQAKLNDKKIISLSTATIPIDPTRRIYNEQMLVVGDAAGMVDPIFAGGIGYAIEGGKLAGKICAKALEEGDFSAKFLSQYQTLWHKTNYYSNIYSKFLLSNVFLNYSNYDKNAYQKMVAISLRRNRFKSLRLLLHRNE